MQKGSLIAITGRIQTGSYEGQDGKRVFTTDVVADSIQFLESRGSSQSSNQANNNQSYDYYNQNANNANTYSQKNSQNPPNTGGNPNYPPTVNQEGYRGAPYNARIDEDPFANSKGPIEVSEDDLPFSFRPVGIDGGLK